MFHAMHLVMREIIQHRFQRWRYLMAHYIPKSTQRRGDKYSRIVVFNPAGARKLWKGWKLLHTFLSPAFLP